MWVRLIAGENREIREALSLEIRSLKAKLDGPSPDLLECMLVDRIVISMLQCAYLDISLSEWESCDRRLAPRARHRTESAHRGLLAAILALVKVLALCRAPETGLVKPQRSAKSAHQAGDAAGLLASQATLGVLRSEPYIARFLRIAGPGEHVPPGELGSVLGISNQQRISGFDLQAFAEHLWINRIAGQDEEHKEKLMAQHQRASG